MQAIILAAGMGKRLREYTQNNTKCMVSVNGVPLIDRLLTQLEGLNLHRIIIVIGYKGKELKQHIEERGCNVDVVFIENPIFDKTNNIYSLGLAKKEMQEDDTILLESDLILDDTIFELLTNNQNPNVAVVSKYETWMDGTMVCLDKDSNIVNFVPKQAFNYKNIDQYYKTVNVYKFSKEFSKSKYVPFLEAYSIAVGDNEYYENVLRVISFLNNQDIKAVQTKDEKWYEIDDKQDLDIAEALFADEKDVLKKYYRRYGGYWRFPKMLDYCYLVNPFFPPQKMIDEIASNIGTLLTEYPSGMSINTLLASKCWGVSEKYILPGNGAAELIKLFLERQQGTIGIVRPTFEEYPNRYDKSKIVTFVPQNNEYRYTVQDLIGYFSEHTVDTLLIINPDNPTGNFIPKTDLLKLAAWFKKRNMHIMIDESFVDFSEEWETSSLLSDTILEEYPGLVVMKSISKSFGVPGLRLGIMASGDIKLIAEMKQQTSIWNINSFAEFFMQIFNKYDAEYKSACRKFVQERNRFEKGLRRISFLRVMPSQANYFLVEVLPPYTAVDIVVKMLKRFNILTRDCSSKEGLDGKQYMRIAVRNSEDNNRLLNALNELFR